MQQFETLQLTPIQLRQLIEAWPGAARIVDSAGSIVAQNENATHYESTFAADGSEVKTYDLGGGLRLQTPRSHAIAADVFIYNNLTESDRRRLPRPAERPVEIQVLSRGITHELRNPLAAIMTAVGLVQDDPGMSEETLMLLGVIRKESLRMNRILTEFSAYVKPRPPQPDDFNIAQALRDEIGHLKRERQDEAIEIEDLLPPHLHVNADEEQIRQVLSHVLHNAVEAMPDGGCLRLEGRTYAGSDNYKVLIIVSDTGSGFSNEAIERAFQPFFSSKSQSTGLGLSIARSAVEAAGGRIWLDNQATALPSNGEPAPGARVHIELPAAQELPSPSPSRHNLPETTPREITQLP
jgi:signal transduction histidine kinase